jgi:hypothetical protein
MTTQIDVKANHGWPVKVTGVNPQTGEEISCGGTVPAGETARSIATHLWISGSMRSSQTRSKSPTPIERRNAPAVLTWRAGLGPAL